MSEIVDNLHKDFESRFGRTPIIVRSPGRVNFIGEHTEYNEGFMLPAAIDRAAYVAIAKSSLPECTIIATDISAKIQFDINSDLEPVTDGDWINYTIGVIDQFEKRGATLEGFNLIFTSDIPISAGLASSAAIECGIAFALNRLFNLGLTNLEIAKLGFAAESGFVGAKSGLMDQIACCMGKKDHALHIDARTLEFHYIPVDLGDYSLVLFDTKIKQSFEHPEFNLRKEECKIGLLAMKENRPQINSLRDATLLDLENAREKISTIIYHRCKYVIQENIRVVKACHALLSKDLDTFGKLMFQTHFGLRKWYEVSCRELNVLGRLAKYEDDVIGGRMMGHGFGGCTINLIKKDKVDRVAKIFHHEYHVLAMSEFDTHQVEISDGISVI